MHTANSTGTDENDPFDLGAVLVFDTAAQDPAEVRRCGRWVRGCSVHRRVD